MPPLASELFVTSPLSLTAGASETSARRAVPGHVLRLERYDSLESVRTDWSVLGRATPNVFSSWEWAQTWWRHFGRQRRLSIFVCRGADGAAKGILPFYEFARAPLRVHRFVGHGPGDQLGPICAEADRPAVAEAFRRSLHELEPGLILAEMMSTPEGWSGAARGRVVSHQASPVLSVQGRTWEEYLRELSSNLRQQVRRLERKLMREHGIRYRLAEPGPRLERDLDCLFRLHAARWSADESPFAHRHGAFHRDFTRLAAERGWLRLWFMEASGTELACWLGYRRDSVEAYYQAGRDPSWGKSSVGLIMLAHSIRAAIQDGMQEYRFLRGDEPFKYRFANGDPGLETALIGNRPLARAAVAGAARAPDHILRPIRRKLAR